MSYGSVGMSHHATEDLAILRSLPGIQVFSPCDLWETVQLTHYLVGQLGPAYFRLDKSLAVVAPRESLAEAGVSCRVLSAHAVKPLDVETLLTASSETAGIISIEEHNVDGGLGGAIAEALMEAGAVPGFFLRMGLRNTFSSIVGSQSYLRKRYSLDAEAIARNVSLKLGIPEPAVTP
jgi:transketolase